MKKIALLLGILSFAAQAEVLTWGGFGTDGATGESIPTAHSVKDDVAVYAALNIEADQEGKKVIVIEDESYLICSKPYSGVSRLNAGCELTLRASQNAIVNRLDGLAGNVTFTGKLATKIFKALPLETNGPIGSARSSAANISCSKVVRPGVEATCTVLNMNVLSMDVEI